jgi:hypothetical protein
MMQPCDWNITHRSFKNIENGGHPDVDWSLYVFAKLFSALCETSLATHGRDL